MIRDELYIDMKMLQSRQRELERKLELARLMAEARLDRSGLLARFLHRLGDLLILVGQMLKARYQPGYPRGRDFASRAE